MKKVPKLLKALRPRILDVCAYEYKLSAEPPKLQPELAIEIEIQKHNKGYSFYAKYKGISINENHIIFKNRLGRQLGYSNVPILADSNTAEAYRGKGLQTFMLTEIARYFASLKGYNAIYVFTYSHNVAMQHSLIKAGYKKLYRAKVYRIASFSIYVKKVYEQ